MYSNIRPRAGLVVLVFALIIQLVSAVPVPTLAPQSGLSFALSSLSNRHGQDLIQRDTGGINGPTSTVSASTNVCRCLSSNTLSVGLPSYSRTLHLTRTMCLLHARFTLLSQL